MPPAQVRPAAFISRYKGLNLSDVSTTRNDLGLTAGLGFRF
jgi:hypothetical protein